MNKANLISLKLANIAKRSNSVYELIVPAVKHSFKVLNLNDIQHLQSYAGKISQNGIRNISDQEVILQSSSFHDILECETRGYWANRRRPKEINNGTTVYLIPNKKEIAVYGLAVCGLQFTASGPSYLSSNPKWPSELL